MEYKIVTDTHKKDMIEQVNRLIKEGWTPLGRCSWENGWYIQTMILNDQPEEQDHELAHWEFVAQLVLVAEQYRKENPSWRKGECYWNALVKIDRYLPRILLNTDADCFYNDDNIPTFFEAIRKKMAARE